MNISVDTLITIVVLVAGLATSYGVLKAQIAGIQSDIVRLEIKQDKYNNLQERTFLNEASTKQAHKRLDTLSHNIRHDFTELHTKIDELLTRVLEK